MVDDDSAAVSLPEVPLLAVLPGTGGLTRLVDKRKVRRDLADVFCAVEEGIKGQRAVDWRLVDEIAPASKFADSVRARAEAMAENSDRRVSICHRCSASSPTTASATRTSKWRSTVMRAVRR
jgi:benzoyl-CoA-dihydrodiol lyase